MPSADLSGSAGGTRSVPASAPVRLFDQWGESPYEVLRYEPVTESNCVSVRRGGEQLEVNDQSVG